VQVQNGGNRSEQADQSCHDPTRIHAIKEVEQYAYLLGEMPGHDDGFSKLPAYFRAEKSVGRMNTSSTLYSSPALSMSGAACFLYSGKAGSA